MPSPTLETAILTTALYIILLISLGMFSIVYQWVFIDSVKIRLGEVANQVAYEITCIYSMCQQSKTEIMLFKPIDIPVSVSEYGYAVELTKTGGVWFVSAYSEVNRVMSASSPLWEEDPDGIIIVETGSGDLRVGSYMIRYNGVLHSGQARPVVWAEKNLSGVIRIGIGWVREAGG